MLNKINAALLKLVRPISSGQLDLNAQASKQSFQRFKPHEKNGNGNKNEAGGSNPEEFKGGQELAPNENPGITPIAGESLENPPTVTPDWKRHLTKNQGLASAFEPILQLFSVLHKSRRIIKQWVGRKAYGEVREEKKRSIGARKGVLVDQNAD